MLKPIMGGNDTGMYSHDHRLFLLDFFLFLIIFYLFNATTVTIFTMNKHITPHMIEKLDRSAYKHEEAKKEDDPDATEDEADSDEDSE